MEVNEPGAIDLERTRQSRDSALLDPHAHVSPSEATITSTTPVPPNTQKPPVAPHHREIASAVEGNQVKEGASSPPLGTRLDEAILAKPTPEHQLGGTPVTGADLSARLGRRLIVLAMDDSLASQTALAWTLKQMVHPERDHLVVVTVANFKTASAILRVGRSPQQDEKTTRREVKAETRAQRICDFAAQHIAAWCRDLGIHLSHEIVSLKAADNYVPEVITDYIRDVNANLLILGSHSGQSTMKRYLRSILKFVTSMISSKCSLTLLLLTFGTFVVVRFWVQHPISA
jgi:nucleotide-binding universal stress UspA family protein